MSSALLYKHRLSKLKEGYQNAFQ
ncbi:hypothetical protein A2U01_0036257, partial [Trifolium medium]|nr:hypothetical protein [Trifolium medium]